MDFSKLTTALKLLGKAELGAPISYCHDSGNDHVAFAGIFTGSAVYL